MADEQDRWLDRATAEILLRGESLEAVDPAVRDRAERLAGTLGVLSVPPVPTSGELPGEAAALAAFRAARAERSDAPEATPVHPGRDALAPPSDAGLVRIGPRGDGAGRPRWSRPLRLGLAAALTVGMVGGVAVAAGTGVLTTPFDGTEPDPAATVSAATSSDGPPASPSPLDGVQGGAGPGRDGAEGGAGGGTAGDRDPGSDDRAAAGSGGGRPDLAASCREVRTGKQLEDARRRALKEAAGGASRVGTYCRSLLAGAGTAAQDRDGARDAGENREARETTREQDPPRNGKGGKGGKGGKSDKGSKGGKSGKGDDRGGDSKGGGGGKGDREGKGGRGSGEGKGGKGDDDDGHRMTPHAGHRHDPHAPSAFGPSPQQRPAFPAHAALTLAKPA
ncbi:hypothetical protein SAM40697_4210 [Streptomyces ambofaciens]|uniref:Uncharacterized protein n=1 Tax=Streptomyces ambofaciens TaxID=1889 RepID=A0ABN4PD32_STRAM|nr:hypothetical protein [Streptomyces ambofaciens]ANB08168.1 hypothetical protein SAM40697_4210 [Streptomyces ambofaciens]